HASELFEEARHTLPQLGIETGAPTLNLAAMMAHKDDVVASNTSGIAYLFKKNKITAFSGTGAIAGPGRVVVTAEDGGASTIETKNIVIATGSVSADLPGITVDETRVVSSTGALKLDRVPETLLVIGAGVIGLE